MPNARIVIGLTALAASAPAYAHGGEFALVVLGQVIAIACGLLVLTVLPSAVRASAFLGMTAALVLYWVAFFLASSNSVVADLIGTLLVFVLPVGAPTVGYCIGLWAATRRTAKRPVPQPFRCGACGAIIEASAAACPSCGMVFRAADESSHAA